MSWEELHARYFHGLSPSGREVSRYAFDALADFMGRKGLYEDRIGALKEFMALPEADAQAVYAELHAHLLRLGYKGSSVRRFLQVIQGYVRQAHSLGLIRWHLPPPRVGAGEAKRAGPATLHALVECAMKKTGGGTLLYWKRNGHRNAAILYALALGLSIEAVTQLLIEDFFPASRTLRDPEDAERRIFLPQEALSHFCAWIAYRQKMRSGSFRLFVEARAPFRPLKPIGVEKIIITLAERCDVGAFNPRLLIGCLKIPKGKRLA